MQVALFLFSALAIGLFLLFNGPLCLVTHSGLFVRGRQAPPWLEKAEWWFSRLAGVAMLSYWSWVAAQSDILATSYLAVTFAVGLFLLLNGSVWVVTRSGAFAHGRESPLWMAKSIPWFNRLAGGGAILWGTYLGIGYMQIALGY